MAIREYKRPVSLTLLVISLILIGTGLYMWLAPHDGPGHGLGRGLGRGHGDGEYSFRRFMKDVHLYIGLFSIFVMGVHIACNWKAMLRHLGLLKDEPHGQSRTLRLPRKHQE